MAFDRSQLRDDLLPTPTYREIWSLLAAHQSERAAGKLRVGALARAAERDGEQALGQYLLQALQAGARPTLVELQQHFGALPSAPRYSDLEQHRLRDDDRLLSLTGATGSQEVMRHG